MSQEQLGSQGGSNPSCDTKLQDIDPEIQKIVNDNYWDLI
jgi:hypothetical protein